MFLFRDEELNNLQINFDKPTSSFDLIFGRRKVGKTSLLNEYIKDKKTIYFTGLELVSNLLLQNFYKLIASFFNLSPNYKIESFDELFEIINSQDLNEKIVIVIDDFHNLLKVDKYALKTITSVWSKYLKNKNIQLIISSSYKSSDKVDISLYSKANSIITLKSLNMNIIKNMLPNLSKNDAMYVYAAFGTNPQYLCLYDENKDFILNIKDNFLSYESFVFHEGMNIIKNDLSDIVTYASILHAVSMGNKKIGDIASFLDVKSSYLTRYMQKLIDIMVLTKIVPINDDPKKSKFGRYEIEDNFLKFWFCYIYPNYNSLHKKDFYPIISHIRKDFSKRLVYDSYKRYIKELIILEPVKFLGYEPKSIGSWWNNKENEIDIVTFNSSNITFIDCRWRRSHSDGNGYEYLKNKSKLFDTTLNKKYIIFAKNSKNN